jgi:4-hydroxy-tetrahydrodipicolinate reductase
MGSEACRAVEAAEDLDLVARVDVDDPLDALVEAGVEVVVDLTAPDAVMDNMRFCVEHGIAVVCGTTGWTDERLDEVRRLARCTPATSVLIAPNFSIGAILMMRFAAEAARFYESVEIVELHHPEQGRRAEWHRPAHGAARRGSAA